MPPVHRIHRPGIAADEDITDYARLYSVDLTANAEEGSVATSTQILDDPDGTLDMSGRFRYAVLESTATGSNQHIWVGTTGTRTWRRGSGDRGSLITGVQREVEVELHDINTLLNNYILTESWANRPAETDVQRIQAIYDNGGFINLADTRFFSTANPFSLPANDFRGQTTYAVMDDCAQESGKNWFIWYAADVDASSLWYDYASSTNYSSIIRLSNVLSDIDEVWTFPISDDTELVRDPSRVYSHIYLPWQNGAAFVGSFPTQLEFSIVHGSMDGYNVKTQAQATARATRYLQQASTEEDVITTTVRLPAEKVNFLMQGMRVQFRASHLPGYQDLFTWMRILRRTVTQEDELNYSIRLEMTGTPAAAAVSCSTVVANLDPQVSGNLTGRPITFDITGGDGDFLALALGAIGQAGFTSEGGEFKAGSPWTPLPPLPPDIGGTHFEAGIGYRSNAAGTVSYDWVSGTTNPTFAGRIVGLIIPTAATAPVQQWQGDAGLGSMMDFATPLTPGNLLILWEVAEGPSGWTNEPVGSSWTHLLTIPQALENDNSDLRLWATCVPDDPSLLESSSAGSSWFALCVEIEIV